MHFDSKKKKKKVPFTVNVITPLTLSPSLRCVNSAFALSCRRWAVPARQLPVRPPEGSAFLRSAPCCSRLPAARGAGFPISVCLWYTAVSSVTQRARCP